MEITEELKAKALACNTAEELLELASENGIELTAEEAGLIFEDMAETPEGELADEELDDVAGGGGCVKSANPYKDILWDRQSDVRFIFNVGDSVQAFAMGCKHHTATCIVRNREAQAVYRTNNSATGMSTSQTLLGYADYYYLEKAPGTKSVFSDGWYRRSDIEK